ncbi:hypothetical protein BCLUESOX_2432 [bacterium endosymbiont of Bathymodiolus sp. 5 South]|jgi:adhesin transport system outer membrane protein|nr:hypothetical protein [uncultured Gammaproteobacteria bacterium]SHN92300.1 hypothetical protein BCLUESOX_2432 [bacterium endosymbiont of Bathymodiolus sp. 5 South]VVM19903.1 hypothetical protein BSPWISOXPB_8715 [uncultured Gammaproteobacteria bacterium]
MFFRCLLVFLLSSFCLSVNAKDDNYSLNGLIHKALNYHPSIKSSASLLSSAKKGLESAKWQYFPTPSVSISRVNATTTDLSYSGDDKVIKLGLNQTLWAGGRIDAGMEKAQAQLSIRKSILLVARRQLAFNVIRSYSAWYSSHLKRKAFSVSKQEHELLQKRIVRRIEQGLSPEIDLSLVSSRLLQVSANLNSAITQHQRALLQLEELVGESLNIDLLIESISTNYVVNGVKKVLLSQTLGIDPKLKELSERVKESHSTYKQVKSSLSPQLNLRVERQWGNHNIINADTENRIFLELSSSFGAGLSILSKIERAKLEEHSILLDLETQNKKTITEFESDWLSYQSLSKQNKLLGSALLAAQKIQQSWYRQFLAGRKQWQDVMNSIREVAQLKSQIADVVAESLSVSWRLMIRVKGVGAI